MTFFRRAFSAYARTLTVLASVHLLIIAWNAAKTGEYAGLTMLDILDIAHIADPGIYAVYVELLLWLAAAVLFLYFWKRQR